jgi:hypothetical protein
MSLRDDVRGTQHGHHPLAFILRLAIRISTLARLHPAVAWNAYGTAPPNTFAVLSASRNRPVLGCTASHYGLS